MGLRLMECCRPRVSCHAFRHSFATHLVEMGYAIRTVQELLGHSGVKTSTIYTHVAAGASVGVRSPLDALGPVTLPEPVTHGPRRRQRTVPGVSIGAPE
jgi:hypothetical protein